MAYFKKFSSREEALEFVDTLPINTIRYMLADCLLEKVAREKIVITQEQFNAYFKIRGLKEDGTEENRGRKPREEK